MSASTASDFGLRARKQRETRERLEEATLFFVDRDGLEPATIERISERAGVSPRTFFNYFESKEDALLGIRRLELNDDLLALHADLYAEADPVESVLGLLFLIARPIVDDVASHRQRARVIQRHPELLATELGYIDQLKGDVLAATVGLLNRSPRWAGECDEGRAQVLLNLCAGAMRYVVPSAVAGGSARNMSELREQCLDLVWSTTSQLVRPT